MNRRAFALGAVMVLATNVVAVVLRAYAEAAFLQSYARPQLPWLFVANAAGFAAATLGYDLLTRRAHTRVVDLALLGTLGVAAAAAPALLHAGAPPVVLVVALAAVSQVAGLALWNRVAAAVAGRDARRMLPRAGAAVTAGGMLAGLGAGGLAIGGDLLAYLGAGVAVLTLGVAVAQARALAAGGAPGAAAPPGTPEGLGPVQRRLLHGLVAVALLEGVVATVVDFQFLGAVKARYATDQELAIALLLFYGGTNALLLVLQVTAVPRILVTRSLPTTAGIHPTLVVAGLLAFLAAPGLLAIAGARTLDQVFRLATSRTAQEVSLSAFPPGPRARWKVLLRGALWPAGAASAALVLLLVSAARREPLAIVGAAIAVAAAWWIAAQLTARRFQAALAAPLQIQTHARRTELARIDLGTLERWAHVAGDAEPRTAALARAALARARVDAADLGDHLRHDEPEVRAALFDQLARAPAPALLQELRAAVAIEDDDRALALAIKALAIAGDGGGLERGRSRAALSREVAEAVVSAERTLGTGDAAAELAALCARDPGWAVALVRARALDEPTLGRVVREALADPARRAGALAVIAAAGPADTIALLGDALEAGAPEAIRAIAELDAAGAAHLARQLAHASPLARLAIARALAGAPAPEVAIAALLGDADPEVAHAALRTALAVARGGGSLPADPIAQAHAAALAALVAHLDARDAAGAWSACARAELELATRGCVARLMWASAVEAAAAGRDPAALVATARRLIGGREPDRRRALDVIQELQAGRAEILAVIERWLRPPAPRDGTPALVAAHDPWLARLCAGELAELEPRLVALRAAPLFAALPGPALASLAGHATARTLEGRLFATGEPGASMFVVVQGALLADRPGAMTRRIEAVGVVGELAVLTGAPRAATVSAAGSAEILEIDRETFRAAARRAPELVLGLTTTLAGWIAPNRPDVL